MKTGSWFDTLVPVPRLPHNRKYSAVTEGQRNDQINAQDGIYFGQIVFQVQITLEHESLSKSIMFAFSDTWKMKYCNVILFFF